MTDSKENSDKKTPGDKEKKTTVQLPISGMSCATCAITIEKGLDETEGVSKANVNFASEKASVEFNPEKTDL
ncbi:MAG TPA: cation transporter, partial [Dehalococcoidales bacterium]|nr:cation transporter [Dehalococcoidales bacterium]